MPTNLPPPESEDSLRERRLSEARRRSFLFTCWLYFAIGLFSTGLGLYFLLGYRKVQSSESQMLVWIFAGILIVFGILRILNALFQLRRLRR
jgi:uncharacterized membrane protein YidH (DUF202 family)